MLSLLSPAKKLLSFDKPYLGNCSQPQFPAQTAELIDIMRKMTAGDIGQLMKLSETLAELNYQRYQDFHLKECPETASYPALLFFQGDVYQGLDAATLNQESLVFAQNHLGILSGLYGLLKPLDRIQAYRLEMGTRLANQRGNTLYDFWGERLTQRINQQLEGHAETTLINLASQEYFKAVKPKKLQAQLIHIDFKQENNGQLKTIGIHAKRARGLMARFIIEQRIDTPAAIKDFREEGYAFQPSLSNDSQFCFVKTL